MREREKKRKRERERETKKAKTNEQIALCLTRRFLLFEVYVLPEKMDW